MMNMPNISTSFAQNQQNLMAQMSSGQRINRAADDAAGLAIAEKLNTQVRGESVATRNMADSQSMLRTAEGALNSTQSVLHRMRELSVQANNGLLTDSDRGIIQQEFSQLRDTIDAIGRDTQFNTRNLLDGSMQGFNTTTGANGDGMQMTIEGALSNQLGAADGSSSLAELDLSSNPREALSVIDRAIQQVAGNRSTLGAYDNRLSHSIENSRTAEISQAASESRIRDADMAQLSIDMNKQQVMQQAYFATQRMGMEQMGLSLNLLR